MALAPKSSGLAVRSPIITDPNRPGKASGLPVVETLGSRTLGGKQGPPTALATDPNVNAAYNALMLGQAGADENRNRFRRNLNTDLANSKANRMKTILANNQGFADRGILSSGIALGRQNEVDTGFDTLDSGLNTSYLDNLSDLDRSILGLSNNYSNAKITASANATKAQADAAAAALLAQSQAQTTQQQIADLMAALAPAPAPDLVPAPVFSNPVIYKPKPVAAKPKPKPVISGQTGQLSQTRLGGPQ
jgi:hypothetical protein